MRVRTHLTSFSPIPVPPLPATPLRGNTTHQFSENQLTGPLPAEIKNMGNLQTFSVHNNDPDTGTHTGPLPHFDTHPNLNEI